MAWDEHFLNDIIDKAIEYQRYVRKRDKAHYQTALRLRARERTLGIPVVILTAVVGTAIFATLQTTTSLVWEIVTGLLSVTAAVLASLQTFFNFSAEAARHEAVAARYGQLWRKFDSFILRHQSQASTRDQCLDAFQEIITDMDELEADTPRIANKIWQDVKAAAERERQLTHAPNP